MSTHHTNLETLEDKDKDSQKMRRIEPEGTSIDSSSSSKENRNDDISIGPNGSSRQIDAPRKSERIAKHKNSASGGDQALCIAAPKGKGGKIEPSTKSKIILFSSIAAPKAHAANPPPKTKTKATSKLKRNTTKKRKTVAPEPEATPAIEEILPFLEERRHLYDAVEYFKDRASNVNSPLRLVRPLTGFDTLEDATTTDIDEDEEDKRSESISRGSDPLPSRTRPTQPTAGPSGSQSPGPSTSYMHPPNRPIIHIHHGL